MSRTTGKKFRNDEKYLAQKMMKFGRKIFFTGEPYNDPGILGAYFWELPEAFYEIFVINFEIVVVNIFGTIFAKMIEDFIVRPSWKNSRFSLQFLLNVDYIFSISRTQHLSLWLAET